MTWLGRIIVLLGSGIYIGAIAYAGWLGLSSEKEPSLGDFLSTTLTGLGGALATVFGAAFGLSDSNKDPRTRSALVTEERLRAAFSFPATATIIAWAYFIALVVGVLFFTIDADKDDAALPIRDIWKTLLGVIVGVIYVQAGKKPAPPAGGPASATVRR